MNRSPSHSFKLTKVFFVVIVLAVSAFLSNTTIASTIETKEIKVEQII